MNPPESRFAVTDPDDPRPSTLPPTDRSLPIALIRARERVMAPVREMLSETGITEQQWRVLRVLSEGGTLDATEVAERASLLLPSLTRIVRSLSDRGFVTRTRDNGDRRRQMLAITPAGQQVIEDNHAEALRIADRIRRSLGHENYEKLLDLLGALQDFR
ncbi:homoprotocatechuate degradation operon regulator, HpaR [Sulfitobacter alexandrii]|uniref:Homoprotocatechuate degradation operon regulator, HpaR n=1 Tax=Sulfitobacter alexandrii TaxID=1917485 RepID=A0A1J0WEE5_9RHOB|nr:homoprotocatechuate degradation operon regulator HpaR [Sulfitobacter alexandrii]APE42552.1 homoprotocatechuate degradation operon regulator, HpaR [Sulfitobacter alexandrii]